MMIPVILSGGSGTRLWPISRKHFPKQFCSLLEETLHRKTILRALKIGSPWIVTSSQLKSLTEIDASAMGLPLDQIIYEPEPRNTAPAIALVNKQLAERYPLETTVVVLSADHYIEDEDSFLASIKAAEKAAARGALVTIGIKPTYPATGYGYIEVERSISTSDCSPAEAVQVKKFHEKPNESAAKLYLDSGHHFWNAGIFVFQIQTMQEMLRKHANEIASCFDATSVTLENLTSVYSKLPKISIDFAVLEKLSGNQLQCVPSNCGWDDIGSWDSLVKYSKEKGQVINHMASNNVVHTEQNKLYALNGVNDLIVVDTKDALLITAKGKSQTVKDIVEVVQKKYPEIADKHSDEIRPWGQFEILKEKDSFKSKLIQVNPFSQISYQSHNQRSEHWLFVEGSGEVVLDEKVIQVKAGSYVFIPTKAKHRVRNTSSQTLAFVEVQTGSYFGEDDIVRYQDDYNRI